MYPDFPISLSIFPCGLMQETVFTSFVCGETFLIVVLGSFSPVNPLWSIVFSFIELQIDQLTFCFYYVSLYILRGS